MACSPSSGHNRLLTRIVRVVLLGIPLMAGCSEQRAVSHIPPFARTPYELFSRDAVVAIALREWRLFGSKVHDPETEQVGKSERDPGLWQRVGEYWWLGLDRNSPESGWTGKHDGHGMVFDPADDGEYAWSAAFVSYVMRIAGAGKAFPYAADHATYINAAKRMKLGLDRGWLMTAERLDAWAPVPGDLICHGRAGAGSLRYDDLPTPELFPSHCDIVVDTSKAGTIGVIGGNINDAVTLRHIAVTAGGKLVRPDGTVVDPDHPWMTVLRINDPVRR